MDVGKNPKIVHQINLTIFQVNISIFDGLGEELT